MTPDHHASASARAKFQADDAVRDAFEAIAPAHGLTLDRDPFDGGYLISSTRHYFRFYRAAHEHARAQMEARDGWQPIETAPRDGTWFLICCEGEADSIEVGCYNPLMHDQFEPVGDDLYRKVVASSYDWSGFNNFHCATHWMPTPAVPAGATLAEPQP